MAVCGCTSGFLFWKKPCDRFALDTCSNFFRRSGSGGDDSDDSDSDDSDSGGSDSGGGDSSGD